MPMVKRLLKPKTLKFQDHPEFTPNLTPKTSSSKLAEHIIAIFDIG